MEYTVMKLTINRDSLYAHYKSGSPLKSNKELTEAVNMVSDEYVLAEMLDKFMTERKDAHENY